MKQLSRTALLVWTIMAWFCQAFLGPHATVATTRVLTTTMLSAEKAAPLVTGEELEKMLTEWDQPLVVDAYATWYVYVLIGVVGMLEYIYSSFIFLISYTGTSRCYLLVPGAALAYSWRPNLKQPHRNLKARFDLLNSTRMPTKAWRHASTSWACPRCFFWQSMKGTKTRVMRKLY
jgi:hypothetical protein